MNRIILIGNGFDLAHGLKTSYADFIEWYWNNWGNVLLASPNKLEEDRLCSFKMYSHVQLAGWSYVWHYRYQIDSLAPDVGLKVIEFAKQNRALCDFTIKSPFFQTICEEMETKNWVDIEDVYYEFLKKSDNPKQLNEDLDFIKDKLVEYLSLLPEPTSNTNIKSQILAPINREDISVESKKNGKNYYRIGRSMTLKIGTDCFWAIKMMKIQLLMWNLLQIYWKKLLIMRQKGKLMKHIPCYYCPTISCC